MTLKISFSNPKKLNEEAARFTRSHPTLSDPLFTLENLNELSKMISSEILSPTKLRPDQKIFPRSVVILPSSEGPPRIIALFTKATRFGDEVLGQGSQCRVKAGLDLCTAEVVAVATRRIQRLSHQKNFWQQIQALSDCRSDHVVPFYGYHEELDPPPEKSRKGSIFMKYFWGNLPKIKDNYNLGEKSQSLFIRQMIEAVRMVHEKGYVHADIKPDNMLVSLEEPEPKILLADFGLAATKFQKRCGTPTHAAPELMLQGFLPNQATDLWSLGCTIFELLANKQFTASVPDPLPNSLRRLANNPVGYQKNMDDRIKLHIPKCYQPLLLSLLQLDPALRRIPDEYLPARDPDPSS